MTKEDNLKLKEIAAAMPPAINYLVRLERGKDILARNPKASAKGEPLEANKMYHVKHAVPVDHYRTIRKIFSKKGMKGVDAHVMDVMQEAIAQEQAAGVETEKV